MHIIASQSDITQLHVDAIVNAANTSLIRGGGVCGAIFRAAGRELSAACVAVGGCPTGEARITPGFKLPSEFVIHAVGPMWHGGQKGEPELLAGAYRSALMLARDHGCTSIAFPAISTGIYSYPLEAATEIAVRTVREFAAEAGSLATVHFACFSEEALRAYTALGVAEAASLGEPS
jgi:O-acetyl-ADP-ribose deacetylase (regulator of RNase III)